MPTLVPGPLAVVHRVFMTTALVAVVIYGAVTLRQWLGGGGAGALAASAVAVLVAAAIARYLWTIRGIGARRVPGRRTPR